MAKERKKMQHIHSSVADKQPKASILEPGELAVNNAAGKEFISTVNSNGEVVRFSSDGKMASMIEKKSIMPYSGSVITDDEKTKAQILIKLNQYASQDTPSYDVVNDAVDMNGDPINPSEDGKTNGAGFAIETEDFALIGGNPEFESVTTDEVKPSQSGGTVTIYRSGTTYLSGDTIEKALEELADKVGQTANYYTTGGSVNPDDGIIELNVAGWSGSPAVVDGLAYFFDKNAIAAAHTSAVTSSGDSAITNTYIIFENKSGDTIFTLDATEFVIDGMVDNVEVGYGTGEHAGEECLIITWNQDSGKDPLVTEIPISMIFDADKYYTKQEINAALGDAFIPSAITSSVTDVILANELVTSAALNDLNGRLVVVEARKDKYTSAGTVTNNGVISLDVANYANSPVNIYGLPEYINGRIGSTSADTFVSGGSVNASNGDIILRRNRLGNVTVSGLSQYFDDRLSGCPTSANTTIEVEGEGESAITKTYIKFYNASGATLSSMTIDASDFVKDGMVESAWTEEIDDVTYLRIKWNADAGKDPDITNISLGDLFNIDNYYTKQESDERFSANTYVVSGEVKDDGIIHLGRNDGTNGVDVSGLAEYVSGYVEAHDTYITGGTFEDGVLQLTTNTGKPVQAISGISAQDTYVVSGRVVDTTLYLKRNDNEPEIEITGLPMPGSVVASPDHYVTSGKCENDTLTLDLVVSNSGETSHVRDIVISGVSSSDNYVVSGEVKDTGIIHLDNKTQNGADVTGLSEYIDNKVSGSTLSGGTFDGDKIVIYQNNSSSVTISGLSDIDVHVTGGAVDSGTGIIDLDYNKAGYEGQISGLAEYVDSKAISSGDVVGDTLTIYYKDGDTTTISGFSVDTNDNKFVNGGNVNQTDGIIYLNYNSGGTPAEVSGLTEYVSGYVKTHDRYVVSGSVDDTTGDITLDMSTDGNAYIYGLGAYVSSLTPSVNDVWVNTSGDTMDGPLTIDYTGGTALNINGDVSVSGNVTATGAMYSSDKRLKENIEVISSEDLENVKNIDFKEFNFISNKSSKKIGVIAQELQDNGLGKLTGTNDAGYLTVDYISLLCLKIAELEKEIKKLKGEE